MSSLQDFFDTVDDAIGEDGAQDLRIQTVSRMAMRRLERLYNFVYMREEKVVSFPATVAGLGVIDLGDGVKTILSGEVRPSGGSLVDGEIRMAFTWTPHVRLDDKRFDEKLPVYIRGRNEAIPLLTTTQTKDFSFLLMRFTQNWPVANFSAYTTHMLFNELEDLFLAEVCLSLLPLSRDADLQAFQRQRDEAIKSLFAEGFIISVEDWT